MTCTITLNGKPRTFSNRLTLRTLFEELSLDPAHRIVELNGTIYTQEHFETITLENNDTVEIIQFMGGGSGINH